MSPVLKKLLEKQIIRFLACGVITAMFNVVLISYLIEVLELNTPLLRNTANVVSLEISVLFSFFVYRFGVWASASWEPRTVFLYQMPLFHLSSGVSILTRSLILFPILDWMGFHYAVNTLIGIAAGSVLNYLLSDRIVFRTKRA